jgi:glycolate oxidase FAD binding subunit
MADTFKARDANDVEAAVQWALGESKSLEIVGQGSKRTLGRPAQSDASIDLSELSGITLYEPEELVLAAKAGTPLAEIEAKLAASGQELAFEPMDYGPILGLPAGRGTIGGVLAANLSGPRRIKAGAARDHFLGATAVSGRGEVFKTGGRVVKNVTGYDLCKLLAGSWGTLAAMTDVVLKTLPRAETEASVVLIGLDAITATKAMSAAMGSPCDVSGAAHLPAEIAARAYEGLPKGKAATALRVEGVEPSVIHRKHALQEILKTFGALDELDAMSSRGLWRAVRDVVPFAASGPSGERMLWRVSTAPTKGAEVARMIGAKLGTKTNAEIMFDWAGGLVWVALGACDDAGVTAVRGAIEACGGHATLIRAPAALRAAGTVVEPQQAGAVALTKRIKQSFDPKGVLGSGRMWAGV